MKFSMIKLIQLTVLTLLSTGALFSNNSEERILKPSSQSIKADGNTDNTKMLQNLLDDIASTGGTLHLPKGTYTISDRLLVELPTNTSVTITCDAGTEIKITKNLKSLLNIYSKNTSGTKIVLKNLSIDGQTSMSQRNELLDSSFYSTGVSISSIEDITVDNCTIKNIYGTGLGVHPKRYEDKTQLRAKDKATITNNYIYNCSGLKSSYNYLKDGRKGGRDYYGDGIRYTGGNKGEISNNTIINNLDEVSVVGRAGIVLEFKNINVLVSNNTIKGYDRGIHIEGTHGGHIISNNIIDNCNSGIFAMSGSNNVVESNPLNILNNTLSDGTLKSSVNKYIIRPSCFIRLYKSTNLLKGTRIQNNKMNINSERSRSYNYIQTAQEGLVITNNTFESKHSGTGIILLHGNVARFDSNTLVNLYYCNARKEVAQHSGNKKSGTTKSNFL